MRFASFSTLFLAAVLSSPALWHVLVVRDIDARTALIRYLIAVPIAAIMLAFLNAMTSGYQTKKTRPPLRVTAVTGEPLQQRRTSDQVAAKD